MSLDDTSGSARLPVTIGPVTRANPVLLILLALIGGGFLWLAFDLLTLTKGREPVVVLIPAGLGALLLAAAVLLWRKGPLARGTLRLDETGVSLHVVSALGRDVGPMHILWTELASVLHVSFRASHHMIGFELTHDGALAHGRVQPSTRRGPRFLTRQIVRLPAAAFERPTDAVLKAILGAAEAAGRSVTDRGGEYIVLTNRRWDIGEPPTAPTG